MDANRSLDDIIKQTKKERKSNNNGSQRKPAGVSKKKDQNQPSRRNNNNNSPRNRPRSGQRNQPRAQPYRGGAGGGRNNRSFDQEWGHDMYSQNATYGGPRRGGLNTGSKLMISNLHLSVNDTDIAELFGKFGDLKGSKNFVHYDSTGKSTGNATVQFVQSGAGQQAINEYNGVTLDGKPMRIELVGGGVVAAYASPPQPYRVAVPAGGGGYRNSQGRGRDSGRGRDRGGRGGRGGGRSAAAKPRPKPKAKSAEDLDSELDDYYNPKKKSEPQNKGRKGTKKEPTLEELDAGMDEYMAARNKSTDATTTED